MHGRRPVAAARRRSLIDALSRLTRYARRPIGRAALGVCLLTAAPLGLTLLSACLPQRPPTQITRRLDGERTVGVFVSPSSYELFVRAEIAAEEQRWEAAIESYRLALAGASEDPLVLARLAIALGKSARFDDANEAVARALELDPESEAAFLARGDLAAMRDDNVGAVAAYEQAVAVAPASEAGPMRLAAALRALGATRRADAVLARLARRGGSAGATAARARLAAALAGDDAEAAGEAALALLRVAPVRARDVREAASRALEAGNVSLATRLIAALPVRESDTALRVRVALARGARSDAEGLLATAPPEALGGAVETARLWLAAGRPERAYELAREAAAIDGAPDAELVAGEAALAAGQLDDAAAAFARVPAEASGGARARAGLVEALTRAGMPALAAEVNAPRAASAPRTTTAVER